LEVVLGIDNVIFISILSSKLPAQEQAKARKLGLAAALFARIGLLCSIFWLIRLTKPFTQLLGHPLSGKDLVLLIGGLFLLWKSVHEIHGTLEGPDHSPKPGGHASLRSVVLQILVIDIVFSLDSVITAVGLAQQVEVMIAAVILALAVMLFAAKPISDFVGRHPTVKMLALAFLLMVGLMLVAEGFGQHIPKGYIYFAMAFSFCVEMLNLRTRKAAGRGEEPPAR
jgi:predicted tellurium resistance membrane protein TerC